MNQDTVQIDTVQINEILCILKRYYDRAPHVAPILFREDAAYRVQKLIEELKKEKDRLYKEIEALQVELIDSLERNLEE